MFSSILIVLLAIAVAWLHFRIKALEKAAPVVGDDVYDAAELAVDRHVSEFHKR